MEYLFLFTGAVQCSKTTFNIHGEREIESEIQKLHSWCNKIEKQPFAFWLLVIFVSEVRGKGRRDKIERFFYSNKLHKIICFGN